MPQIRPNRFEFEAWNTDGVVLQAGDFSEGCPIFMGFPGSWLVSPWLTKKGPRGWFLRAIFLGGGWNYYPVNLGDYEQLKHDITGYLVFFW